MSETDTLDTNDAPRMKRSGRNDPLRQYDPVGNFFKQFGNENHHKQAFDKAMGQAVEAARGLKRINIWKIGMLLLGGAAAAVCITGLVALPFSAVAMATGVIGHKIADIRIPKIEELHSEALQKLDTLGETAASMHDKMAEQQSQQEHHRQRDFEKPIPKADKNLEMQLDSDLSVSIEEDEYEDEATNSEYSDLQLEGGEPRYTTEQLQLALGQLKEQQLQMT